MKKLLFLLAFSGFCGPMQAQVVEKITVFKRKLGHDTTAGLTINFDDLPRIDTLKISGLLIPTDFTNLLATARKKTRHWQQKETGGFSGIMQIAGQPHQYLYYGPNLLVDLTAHKNYWLDSTAGAAFDQKIQLLPVLPR